MPISNNKVILKNSTDLNSRQKVTPKYFVKLRCFFYPPIYSSHWESSDDLIEQKIIPLRIH